MAESSASETMRPARYWFVSSSLFTLSPVVVVAPIRFTATSWPTSGLPRQFFVMAENKDLVPLGGPRREVTYPNLQPRFIREILQEEAIAIAATSISGDHQAGRSGVQPMLHHQRRMLSTANAAVSWSPPTSRPPPPCLSIAAILAPPMAHG